MEKYAVEFMTIALAHLIAVASPGPDFAIVMKHSIQFGKRIALITSIGVGTAILVHVVYALMGIGLIINSTPWLYDALIIVAASFLVYLGLSACRSPAPLSAEPKKLGAESNAGAEANQNGQMQSNNQAAIESLSDRKAFAIGFMTNGLNPKATLFFLSLFTVVVSESTPFIIKGAYGIYLAIATMAWFCFLSMILSKPKVRQFFGQKGYLFDRVMGVALILLAAQIVYSELLIKII